MFVCNFCLTKEYLLEKVGTPIFNYKNMKTKYHIITSIEEVDTLILSCKYTKYCCYDWESNAEPIYNKSFHTTILSISFMPGFGCSIPTEHPETPKKFQKLWKKAILKIGHELLEDDSIIKVAWNAKFDNQIWEKFGIYYRGTLIDGMLAKYLLNEKRPNGLKDMVRRYLPDQGDYEKQDAFDKLPWDKKPLKELCQYGCQDTDYTLRLALFFEKKIIDLGMYNTFRNLIMTASRVLTYAEKQGLLLDRNFNQKLLDEYKPKIEAAYQAIYDLPRVKKFTRQYNQRKIDNYISKIEQEIEDLDPEKDAKKIKSREDKISRIKAGEFTTKKEQELIRPLNLGSPLDLPELLFSEEGFNFPINKRSDKGKPSTDEETLVALRMTVKNPESPKAILLDKLLELRGLEKMYTTYIQGWHDKVQDDDCLHGKFNIIGTESGRLSSSEPNMQQVPKTSVDPNIKKQLIAPKGKLYFAMDFSQAELRIMAHLSGDETYLRAFREGQDPHLAIAADKYGVPYDEALKAYDDESHPDHKMWKNRRKQAKQIAFGLIYGIGANLLAIKLSDPKAGIIVSKEEAQKEMDEYFSQHPKLKKFKEKQEKVLRKTGYLVSLFGRKRRLPEIYGTKEESAYAIRLALNFPCQSAASDMNLFGSILLFWLMRQGKFPLMDLVCLVHDASYFFTDPKDINIYTVYRMWDLFRNPLTKPFFGFSIDDIDMSMSYEIGRAMAEELPFIPGYDYNKMLEPDFSVEEYMEEAKKWKHISIKDYPRIFKNEMRKYERYYNR